MALLGWLSLTVTIARVGAQPSPSVQSRIASAIASSAGKLPDQVDWTTFVNPFIGTDNYGDVCPGASVPFGMVKITTDMTGYAPAGYVADRTAVIRGLSPLHDSGTGSYDGSYGNFEIMPVECSEGFDSCPVTLVNRLRLRAPSTDDAAPGYFSLTLDNGVKMEATSTRRAGLERFTIPSNANSTSFFVLDMSNDLPNSFQGGQMTINPQTGRIMIGGTWRSSFSPLADTYNAFACYDLFNGGTQKLDKYGIWSNDSSGLSRRLGQTHISAGAPAQNSGYEAGALFSFVPQADPYVIRVGISFVSSEQACANAESEVGTATFDEVRTRSVAAWNERLKRIEIDLGSTSPNITQMFYSSLYRASLTPNNATGETQGLFANTPYSYFDSLYCSWDTFRTAFPLMSLTSPETYAEIVQTYLDGWRKRGWMPECRANNIPGFVQGGTSGDVIVGHFAINFHNEAQALGIDLHDIMNAQLADGEKQSSNWDVEGRQILYKQYGYVPAGVNDTSSKGRPTREGSRTLEYAFEDFSIRQVALLLGKQDVFADYNNRSLWYRNVWDATLESDGFTGFMQKRYANGSFAGIDPAACSPNDRQQRSCSLQIENDSGFYESSSWEYSFFAPQDTAYIIELMGGIEQYVKRLDHFFDAGYYLAGNEPSFQTPIGYHYAGLPAESVVRVRQVVFDNFGAYAGGLPGNDDQAAMGTLLAFHLLGLYPVPGSSELLILSPFTPKYTVHNPYLGKSTTVTVTNWDSGSITRDIPGGASAYVREVKINGVTASSRCAFDFYDTFRVGANIEIILTADKTEAAGCTGALPQSLSTGGFPSIRS